MQEKANQIKWTNQRNAALTIMKEWDGQRGSEDAVKVVGVRLETNNKSNNNNNNRDAANGTAKKTGQSARRCNQAKRKKSGESEMASYRLFLGFLLTLSYANHCSLKKQAKKKTYNK